MSPIEKLHQVTKELYSFLEKQPLEEERDEYIKYINFLLDKRETILPDLSPPSTEKDKALVEEIQVIDNDVRIKLKALFNMIGKDLNNLKKQKVSHQKYVNPYASTNSMDGTFFDKKK
ncbi:hypothetical protein [Bacillus sp. AK128]